MKKVQLLVDIKQNVIYVENQRGVFVDMSVKVFQEIGLQVGGMGRIAPPL